MRTSNCKQRSEKWHELRKGKIGGTRYGQAVSTRKNKLLYELLAERMSDYPAEEVFVNEAMQFGIDNEPFARDTYSKQAGIKFREVGLIYSDFSKIHQASPDGLNRKHGIVLEVKCTQDISTQVRRFFEGIDSDHLPQVINYFVVSDSIKEVHWISYCPYSLRVIVAVIVKREQYAAEIESGRKRIKEIEKQLNDMEQAFKF